MCQTQIADVQLVNKGLYAFSALVQADAAIFGLFAVFLVYRLQALESNMQTALNVGRSSHSSAQAEFEQLVLGVPIQQIHGILSRFSTSIYLEHLKTVAFTPKWKAQATRSSIPVLISIVLHASLCCVGLYYVDSVESILGLDPRIRIIFILVSFALLLAFIAFAGYRSFSLLTERPIDPVPTVDFVKLSSEAVLALFPRQRHVHYVFRFGSRKSNRFVRLSLDGPNQLFFLPMIQKGKHDFEVTYNTGTLSQEQVSTLLGEMNRESIKYWPNVAT